MNRNKKLILSIILFGLIITACSALSTAGANELEDTKWDLLFIRKSVPIAGSTITISFKDGQINGSSGCNSYFGEYKINGNEISFGPLASTEMACMDPEDLMQQEQEYLRFMAEVVTFEVDGEQLVLKQAGQDQLTFKRTAVD